MTEQKWRSWEEEGFKGLGYLVGEDGIENYWEVYSLAEDVWNYLMQLREALPHDSDDEDPLKGVPDLDVNDTKKWVHAAHIPGVKIQSLRTMRNRGWKSKDGKAGQEKVKTGTGRIWRKDGQSVYYYVPSLPAPTRRQLTQNPRKNSAAE